MKRTLLLILVVCLLLGLLVAVNRIIGGRAGEQPEAERIAKPEAAPETKPEVTSEVKPEVQENPVAVVEMEKGGVIEIEVYPKESPITAGNFISLVEKGFYNGLVFHRVEPGFVVQTGDPTGTGNGGPGYTIKDEATPFLHDKGAVGMAKSQLPNSAGSQWYICLEPAHFLDGGYTVFGKVVKGMDVVAKIRIGDRMKKVTLRTPPTPKSESGK